MGYPKSLSLYFTESFSGFQQSMPRKRLATSESARGGALVRAGLGVVPPAGSPDATVFAADLV